MALKSSGVTMETVNSTLSPYLDAHSLLARRRCTSGTTSPLCEVSSHVFTCRGYCAALMKPAVVYDILIIPTGFDLRVLAAGHPRIQQLRDTSHTCELQCFCKLACKMMNAQCGSTSWIPSRHLRIDNIKTSVDGWQPQHPEDPQLVPQRMQPLLHDNRQHEDGKNNPALVETHRLKLADGVLEAAEASAMVSWVRICWNWVTLLSKPRACLIGIADICFPALAQDHYLIKSIEHL
eukprot:1740579-Amphidinium_carterae.1